jgi:branched-chain amino acid transport system ATP-binding protein
MKGLLEIKSVSKSFGGVKAVRNFSMHLERGNIVSVIGPNGAGKTTVLNLISRIYKLDEGEIFFNGIKLNDKKQHKIAKYGIGRTFQNIRLFDSLNIMENVMAAIDAVSEYNILDAVFLTKRKRKIDKKAIDKSMSLIKLLGIEKFRNEKPGNLPYGIQKKVEMARALANNPKLLLLDEPVAGMNTGELIDYIGLIHKLNVDLSLSILLIEHRMEAVMNLSRWIYVLNFGEKIAEGKPEDIQNNPDVMRIYMGRED